MLRVAVRRILSLIPVLFLVTLVAFFLQVLMGGNPAVAMAGLSATPEQIADIERQEHLSEPAIIRYWYWLDGVFHGNLGISYASQRPVLTELAHYFPVTASLTIASLVLIVIIGVPLGILQGMRAGSAVDKGLLGFVSVAISAPGFWVGTMLVFLLAVKVKLFPALGYVSFQTSPFEWFTHIFLPALTLSLGGFGIIARFLRTGIVGVSNENFVRALHARGLSHRRIAYKHVLKNASLSTITILGLNIGYLLSGAVIVEQIFTLPGMGTYALTSIQSRDSPAVEGVILTTAIVIMLVNLLTDLTYSYLNPKVRLS
jgi:peptide/nickel transport system permease protein